MEVRLTNVIDSFWADEEELQFMSDDEVIELVKDDIRAFLEHADWEVVRS